MKKPLPAFDDLYSLPFFDDQDREFVENLRQKIESAPDLDHSLSAEQKIREWVKRFGQWGILAEIYGESAAETSLTRVILGREVLARHSILADLAFVMQFLGGIPLLFSQNEPIKAAMAGIKDGSKVGAFAITEPEAGTDLSRLSTRARKEKNSFIIKGEKHLISNVGAADGYVVFALLEGVEGYEGKVGAFYVPTGLEGMREVSMAGMVPHPLGKLILEDVSVPLDHMIGEAGKGMKAALTTLSFCRPTVGAAACGMARRALEEAINHTQNREAFGGVLADLPLVKSKLSEAIAELDAVRLLVYRAAWLRDQSPHTRHDRASSTAKWRATETAQRIIDQSLQLCGGIATLEGSKLSELYRAVRPLRIYEGASEIHQMLVFEQFLAEK